MKFARPIKSIKDEIGEPIQRIGIIALLALCIAIGAFFIAIGKVDDVS
jgi:hypothetical protein